LAIETNRVGANIDHVSSDDKHGDGYPDDVRWSAHACVHSPDSRIPVSLTSRVRAIVDHALFDDDEFGDGYADDLFTTGNSSTASTPSLMSSVFSKRKTEAGKSGGDGYPAEDLSCFTFAASDCLLADGDVLCDGYTHDLTSPVTARQRYYPANQGLVSTYSSKRLRN